MRHAPHFVALTLAALSLAAQAQTLPPPPVSPASIVNYEYDAQGNPTKTIQAPGVLNFNTTSTYDKLGRRKDTTDAKAGITRFDYNGGEDLTQVTDPRNLVTQYPRNGLGDATQLISPDTGTATNNTLDAAGRPLTRTDSRGVLATYSYDPLNRLTGVGYSKASLTSRSFSQTYDQTGAGFAHGIGRLTSTTFPEGSTQYSYDPQGRLTSSVQRVNAATGANSAQLTHTVGYASNGAIESYDSAGVLTRIDRGAGQSLVFTYSSPSTPVAVAPGAGYLINVTDSFGRSMPFTYSASGLIKQITDPAGPVIAASYNKGNLSALTWPDAKVRQFLYENASFAWALTGVVDERGIRKNAPSATTRRAEPSVPSTPVL